MDKEFHYWVTGIISEYAGFPANDCQTIAYSSQYTDDNNRVVEVFDDEFDVLPSYVTHVSQTEDILQPKDDIMRIYPLFHFVPGDFDSPSPRIDGKKHRLLTTPDSPYANDIMSYTLKNAVSRYLSGDKSCLHRIGISAHCYVDTWAHQNFIGWYDDMNGLPKVGWPNIGHFDAEHNPDIVNHSWKDQRLTNPDIMNNERFIGAAQRLYEHLSGFCQQVNLAPAGSWSQLATFLNSTWGLDKASRMNSYMNHTNSLENYNDLAWIDLAAELKTVPTDGSVIEKYVWKSHVDRTTTDWYKFQEAAKGHIVDAASILRPAFKQAGVHI